MRDSPCMDNAQIRPLVYYLIIAISDRYSLNSLLHTTLKLALVVVVFCLSSAFQRSRRPINSFTNRADPRAFLLYLLSSSTRNGTITTRLLA
jgi:hypothetical protein